MHFLHTCKGGQPFQPSFIDWGVSPAAPIGIDDPTYSSVGDEREAKCANDSEFLHAESRPRRMDRKIGQARFDALADGALADPRSVRARLAGRRSPPHPDFEVAIVLQQGRKAHAGRSELLHLLEETRQHLIQIQTAGDGLHRNEQLPRRRPWHVFGSPAGVRPIGRSKLLAQRTPSMGVFRGIH
jgi:hypothetical protein